MKDSPEQRKVQEAMLPLTYWLLKLGSVVVPRLPLRLVLAVTQVIATLAWATNASRRRLLASNLRRIQGQECTMVQFSWKSRAVFYHTLRNYIDLFRLPHISSDELERQMQVTGWEYLQAAYAAGKGVILVSAHLGNFDYAAQLIAARGYPLTIVVEHLHPEAVFQLVTSLRGSRGIRLIAADANLLRVVRALRNGEIVLLASDRNLQGTGEKVTLFGCPETLPDGAVVLARRTGAGVVGAFCRRTGLVTAVGYFEPVPLVWTSAAEADLADAMRRLAGMLERAIRLCPEQWVAADRVLSPSRKQSLAAAPMHAARAKN